ncbi:response regulator [Paucibacter sp. APW11]|uniref:Response regulator n=1 Tax=Roseateles aquae TaxID=3077235 RepID=A0ABU3PDZ6_9BURK|nr:response regulator [Paucibacter sp. APW11]MDT9000791.1 response regulator [Paucibacter sp. APW11]
MTILVLDDDADIGIAARLLLQRRCGPVLTLQQPAQLLAALRSQAVDLLLLDMNFLPGRSDGAQGLALLQQVLALPEAPRVIVMTAYAEVELAVQALKLGAFDFITKPWDNARLLATVQTALAGRVADDDGDVKRPAEESAVMRELRRLLATVAPTEAPVLLLGAAGSGRSTLAQALHQASAHTSEALTVLSPAAIEAPEQTLAALRGGSVLLDEAFALPLAAQQRWLAALIAREALPEAPRLISSSQLAEAQLFDVQRVLPAWLYRLNTVVLRLPGLRQRREDIPRLAAQFLAQAAARLNKPPRPCSPQALQQLQAQDWPGQLHQLRQACERAVLLAGGPRYEIADFGLADGAGETGVAALELGGETLSLQARERAAVAQAMNDAQGNISQAARLLGLSRAALYRRLEKHGF